MPLDATLCQLMPINATRCQLQLNLAKLELWLDTSVLFWMGGWVGGWLGGWVGGWVVGFAETKADSVQLKLGLGLSLTKISNVFGNYFYVKNGITRVFEVKLQANFDLDLM